MKNIREIQSSPEYDGLMCDEAWRLLSDFIGQDCGCPSTQHPGDVQRFRNFIDHIEAHDKKATPKALAKIICEELGWAEWLLLDFEKSLRPTRSFS